MSRDPGPNGIPRRLVLASRNPGKLAELRQLLRGLPVEVVAPAEFPMGVDGGGVGGLPPSFLPEVDEIGATFAENAILKARAAAAWSGEWALADDSGLEVDALGGAPGVHSRRYAAPGATDADRNARLLSELSGVPEAARSARFRCVAAIAAPDGRVWTTEGTCDGCIASEPRGSHGFGYDPIFHLPDRDRTMAELTPEEKNRISHRARALAAMVDLLRVIHWDR